MAIGSSDRGAGKFAAETCTVKAVEELQDAEIVEVGRREGEEFYDAYSRMRERPTATLVALVLIHREQFGRERRLVVH